MGERISDSCVRPVVTFSVYLSPLPYTHGPYDHILSIKENHTGKNSKPIPATAAYLSYLLVRPSFASSDRNLLCLPSPSPVPSPVSTNLPYRAVAWRQHTLWGPCLRLGMNTRGRKSTPDDRSG